MKNFRRVYFYLLLSPICLGFSACSVESKLDEVETSVNKAGDSINRTVRNAQDKSCENKNGKMACAGQKMKHKSENFSDSVKTKTTEMKNKAKKL